MQSKELGSLICFHRKRAGLTQIELAEHSGVSRSVVQELEAGAGRTTWSNMEAVLEVLNLRLEPEGPLVKAWRNSIEEAS